MFFYNLYIRKIRFLIVAEYFYHVRKIRIGNFENSLDFQAEPSICSFSLWNCQSFFCNIRKIRTITFFAKIFVLKKIIFTKYFIKFLACA